MSKKTIFISIILGVALLAGSVFVWSLYRPGEAIDTIMRVSREVGLRKPLDKKEYEPALQDAIAKGDLKKVIETTVSVRTKTDTGERGYLTAIVVENVELFKTGKRLVAVRNIKNLLDRPRVQENPRVKAMLINTLLSFSQMTRLKVVQDEIFSGSLQKYRVGDNDWYASANALAAESIRNYPTSYAYMHMGRYATDRIIDLKYTYNLTQEEKEKLAQQILTWLQIMKNLQERQEANDRDSVYVFEEPIQAHRSRMFLLLGVARVYIGDQTYIDMAKEELAEVERIAETGRNSDGTYNLIYAEHLAQAYDQYMLAIYHMNHRPGQYGMEPGTPAYEEVGMMVDKLVKVVNSEPESFKSFLRYMSEFVQPGTQFSRWKKIYVSLGEMFPAHKEMLIKYSGWEEAFNTPFEKL